MFFVTEVQSQIIHSWLLFYGCNFYVLLGYYAFYTKEYSHYDKDTNTYREPLNAEAI
jgi:hypothetical protein